MIVRLRALPPLTRVGQSGTSALKISAIANKHEHTANKTHHIHTLNIATTMSVTFADERRAKQHQRAKY
jgi:hypothetical protein